MKKIIIAAVAVALVLSALVPQAPSANGFGYRQGANVNAQNATTTQTKVERSQLQLDRRLLTLQSALIMLTKMATGCVIIA